jgi:hypothetical protein
MFMEINNEFIHALLVVGIANISATLCALSAGAVVANALKAGENLNAEEAPSRLKSVAIAAFTAGVIGLAAAAESADRYLP